MSVCIGAVYRTNIQSTITRRRNLNRTIAVGLVINAGSFILCCFNCIVVSKYRIILEVIFEEVYKAGDHSLSFELVLTCKCKNFFLACTGISCRLNFSFTGGDYFWNLIPCGKSVINCVEHSFVCGNINSISKWIEETHVISKTILWRYEHCVFLNFRILILRLLNTVGNTCTGEQVSINLAKVKELIERRSFAFALKHTVNRLHCSLNRTVNNICHTITVTCGFFAAVVCTFYSNYWVVVNLETALNIETSLGLIEIAWKSSVLTVGNFHSTTTLSYIILIEWTETGLWLCVRVYNNMRIE